MKNALLFAFYFLLLAGTNAQDRQGFIGLGLGVTLPQGGKFTSTGTANNAGFAKAGMLADLTAGYRFSKYLGLMAQIRSQAPAYDAETSQARLQAGMPGKQVSFESDPYACLAFMVGPFVSVPLAKDRKVALELRLLGGYATVHLPEQRVTIDGRTVTQSSSFPKGSAVAWQAGAGVRVNLGSRVGLGLHTDYFSFTPEFKTSASGGHKQVLWPVNLVNTALSVGYLFK